MGWNGNNGEAHVSQNSANQVRGKRRSLVYGVLAGLVFIVLGGVVVLRLGREDKGIEEYAAKSAKSKTIAVAQPKISNKTSVPQEEKKAVRRTAKGTIIPDRVQPDKFGILRYPGGLRWVDTNNLDLVKHPQPKRLFKHQSENSIALLLTLDPDKMCPFLVGRRPAYNARFVEDFKASLNEPEEYPETDTPEEREVRKMVYQTKKEMAEALQRGEDIAKMMNEAQADLDRVVEHKDTLMKQLREVKDSEKYSDDDVRDFITAANKILKKEGLKELAMPNLAFRQTRLARIRERRANAQKNEN